MIDRDYQQPRVDTVDDTLIGCDIWWQEVHGFILIGLYDRFSCGVGIADVARERCPERWAELQAIEEELRQFLQPGVEVPTRELLSRLRLWRETALRVEFEMMGI